MDKPVRPMPVLFYCRGCERDAAAREVGQGLDRRGLCEAYAAGTEAARARARYPVYALEGCREGCAARWLAGAGVRPARHFFLDPQQSAEAELQRISRLAS